MSKYVNPFTDNVLETAKNEAKIQTQKDIAKKMKNRNTPIEYIIEDTGLSKEEIEKL